MTDPMTPLTPEDEANATFKAGRIVGAFIVACGSLIVCTAVAAITLIVVRAIWRLT